MTLRQFFLIAFECALAGFAATVAIRWADGAFSQALFIAVAVFCAGAAVAMLTDLAMRG